MKVEAKYGQTAREILRTFFENAIGDIEGLGWDKTMGWGGGLGVLMV